LKARIFILGGASAVALVVALAQTEVIPTASPAPAPSANPAPTPSATDESRPTSVTTPTSDAEMNAAGQPLAPQEPGVSPRAEAEETVLPEGVADEVTLQEEPTRKRWRIVPVFAAGVVYDDNIFVTNTDRVSDLIWTISLGLAFELGDFRGEDENYLVGQWLGIPTIYTRNSEQSAFNQSAFLSGQYRWNKLVAQLQTNFSMFRGPSRQVNTIVATTTFANTLRFQYDYSDKTSFDWAFSQSLSFAESFSSNYQYEVRGGAEYQLFPKTRVGLEGIAGVLDSTGSPLQYSGQGRVRISYSGSEKLSFTLSAGAQVLQIEGGDEIRIFPVFSFTGTYRPFDGTSFGIVGYRNVTGSLLDGQDIVATGIEISVQQRFFQKFIAQIACGYEYDEYFDTTDEAPTDRVDNFVYIRPRLSYSFIEWLTASIFYEFRQTSSTEAESSFYDNRIGMEIATKF